MSRDSIATPPVVYLPVVGFPGYRVGTDGSVWTCWERPGICEKFVMTTRWRRMKLDRSKAGYFAISLSKDGRYYRRRINRLVLETFVGPCPKGCHAAHDSGVRTDNRLVNLAWKTPKENNADKKRHGTWQGGEKNASAKLTAHQVLEIRAKIGTAKNTHIAAEYGVTSSLIGQIAARKVWSHI